jgi:hypothetical protein
VLGADLHEANGRWRLVKFLNQQRVYAIRTLLQGQSSADAEAFAAAVTRLVAAGHTLTSLVVDLHCPSGVNMPRRWSCEIRPKAGVARTVKAAQGKHAGERKPMRLNGSKSTVAGNDDGSRSQTGLPG